jgi:hypothetical protein
MKALCPCCLGKGVYPAKVNDRKRGCFMADRPCPCCDGAKLIHEDDARQWLAKYGAPQAQLIG